MAPFPLAPPAFSGDSRRVPAGNAFEWLRNGWTLFVAAPVVWFFIALALLLANVILAMVPLFGQIASLVLAPMLAAGGLQACRNSAELRGPAFTDLFWAFQNRTVPLATLGLIYLAGMAALVAVSVVLVGGGAFAGALFGGGHSTAGAVGGGLFASLLAGLIVLLAGIPLFMAIWFAPALVAFNDMAPVDALRASFFACLKNLGAIVVFSIVFVVAGFFATLLAGLGWLILLPVVFGALYASYRDVFPTA